MPSSDTFSIKPVRELLDRWLVERSEVVDPFARNSNIGTITNDLNPNTKAQFHMEAVDFLDLLIQSGLSGLIDAALFDPPYSPRQISEVYQSVGIRAGMKETQNGRLYKEVKDRLSVLLKSGGVAVCCGWNSSGMGVNRGFELREILLVPHGGAHNDTIVTVEEKL